MTNSSRCPTRLASALICVTVSEQPAPRFWTVLIKVAYLTVCVSDPVLLAKFVSPE